MIRVCLSLQCYANKIDPLGQCILGLTSDTERHKESLLTLNQRLQASIRYLFSKDKEYESIGRPRERWIGATVPTCDVLLFLSVRKTGYRQCVGYALANTRVRLDDFYQFYPAEKLFDLFIGAQPVSTAESTAKEHVNVRSSVSCSRRCDRFLPRRSRVSFASTRSSPIELRSKRPYVNQRSNKCP